MIQLLQNPLLHSRTDKVHGLHLFNVYRPAADMSTERKLTSTYTFVSFFHRLVSRRQILVSLQIEKFEVTLFSFEDKETPMIQNRLALARFEKTKKHEKRHVCWQVETSISVHLPRLAQWPRKWGVGLGGEWGTDLRCIVCVPSSNLTWEKKYFK